MGSDGSITNDGGSGCIHGWDLGIRDINPIFL
jgi:hypothetical protein